MVGLEGVRNKGRSYGWFLGISGMMCRDGMEVKVREQSEEHVSGKGRSRDFDPATLSLSNRVC